jgi:cytochrome c
MSRWVEARIGAAVLALWPLLAVPGDAPWSSIGRDPTPAEIAAWDRDVRPDGTGLPEGRGSVAEGQALYDAKCAACQGEFGESNQWLQLAGGVRSLAGDAPLRTTGSKLNHATTLFDYIRRAMPLQAPGSLSDDESYALTAYVLYLNEIVDAQAVMDRRAILAARMSNRDGFSTNHGLWHRDGQPDVTAPRCMQDCAPRAAVRSELPAHVRNAHGRLWKQMRPLGPVRGADTALPPPEGPMSASRHVRGLRPAGGDAGAR